MTEMTAAKLVGGNVRAELARAGKTQAWLAGVLGLSQQVVSERLRGRVAFDVDELTKVAGALGVPVAALMPEPTRAAS
jgi:transcriptional regulator with XRE-family HTH domain